jgi:ribosomal protein L40E
MALVPASANRIFKGVWICMRCNHRNRSGKGTKPEKCRKCGSNKLRQRKKGKKKAG